MVIVSVLRNKPRFLKESSPPAHDHGLKYNRGKPNDIADTYFVRAWFSARRDIDHEIVKDWKYSIGWTVLQSRDTDGKQCWKTVDHFSMLPHGWIPKNGVDFFQQFLLHLKDSWQGLCDRAHERLFKLVSFPIFLSGLDANRLLYGIASRCPHPKRKESLPHRQPS